ncbi:HET-domain-containing protein [Aulographum hederae CBS 113979]|uniref:HET-domain-containing protein n=1 Tax=Aulographum hederae CBS 113979 TaxID=1176131 RepID=A0A6G1HC36_9PEZI|nr:HET-domain-containing protein [Aulographum hederae CBS 113979]
MPPFKVPSILKRLKRRRLCNSSKNSRDGTLDNDWYSDNDDDDDEDDSDVESSPEDIPPFKNDIKQICSGCATIPLTYMLQQPQRFMSRASRAMYSSHSSYYLGTFEEMHAKAERGGCLLCRAWLKLLPPLDGYAEGKYPEQSNFSVQPATSLSTGLFDLLERDWRNTSLHSTKLYISDSSRRHKGVEFMVTVNRGSFYLNRDDVRWNELKSQVDFRLPLEWMRYCEENHETCSVWSRPRLREALKVFRLIDCKRTLSTGKLCVVVPDEIPEYAALSYVWGKQTDDGSGKEAPLESSTRDENRRDTSTPYRLENLPKAIRDSIHATTKLNINHLWIDKYCIDQADSASKHETIMKMDLIYSAAKITLIAAAGAASSHGIPGVSSSSTRTPLQSIEVSKTIAFVPIKHAKDAIQNTVWATRAWTLQEGLLARRRLVFTPEQVYFECREMQLAETLSAPLDLIHQSHYESRLKGGYFHNMTNHHIRYFRLLHIFCDYTRRNLSFDSDRLNAFLGILNSMSPSMSHVWGVSMSAEEDVKQSFIRSLGWDHEKKWAQESRSPLKPEKTFPSWAWAAWEGPKDYNQLVHTEDIGVTFHLNDGSKLDLSNDSIENDSAKLERHTSHRITLQTYILTPDTLVKSDGKVFYEYIYTFNNYRCAIQHYLGNEADELVLEKICNETCKLVYTGSLLHAGSRISAEARFLIARDTGNGDGDGNQLTLERIGLLKIMFDMNQDEMQYLREHAKFGSVDLV